MIFRSPQIRKVK